MASRGQPSTSLRLGGSSTCQKYRMKGRRPPALRLLPSEFFVVARHGVGQSLLAAACPLFVYSHRGLKCWASSAWGGSSELEGDPFEEVEFGIGQS